MAIQNGNNLIVTVDSNEVGFSQSCSISITNDIIQRSHKGLYNFTNARSGRKTVTVSTNGLYDPTNAGQDAVLSELMGTNETVTLTWGVASGAGTEKYSGSFIVASAELNADENADGTYSVSFQNAGEVTRTENVA